MKKLVLSFFVFHFSFFVLHLGVAQVIHVPADQPTIQAGINAAANGDTILVADGTYLENINFNGKAITVASHFLMDADTNHINNTIIDGSQPVDPDYGSVVTFITAEDSTSVLCGFTITGGTGTVFSFDNWRIGGGILCYYASAKIVHNKIINNSVSSALETGGGGIASYHDLGEMWLVAENNTISGNLCHSSTSAFGGGIMAGNHAMIRNNVIRNNLATAEEYAVGGGIHFQNSYGDADTVILENNRINRNTASSASMAWGGGFNSINNYILVKNNMIHQDSLYGHTIFGGAFRISTPVYVEIMDCNISQNRVEKLEIYWGAGVFVSSPLGPVLVYNNEFSYNQGEQSATGAGGGLSIIDGMMVPITVDGNRFLYNSGYHGGGFYSRSNYNLRLINNLFIGNEAFRGGAVGIFNNTDPGTEQRPLIANNTLYANTASNDAGAFRFSGTFNGPVIINCIFWGNACGSGKDIRNWSTLPITVSFSDLNTGHIIGPWTGEFNFNADPEFMAGDSLCHLSLTSPCKNAGTASLEVSGIVYNAPVTDLDGEGRPDPKYNLHDVGADERWEDPPAPFALDPDTVGPDYFVARWHSVALATGYNLDVAFDANFTGMVPGYDNLHTGNDTTALVSGLEAMTYYYRVRAHNTLFTSQNSNVIVVMGVGNEELRIKNLELRIDVYPNPTGGNTDFGFRISDFGRVTLKICDIHGRQVATVVDRVMPAGEHVVRFDASALPAGIYVVELRAEGVGHRAEGIGQRAVCKLVVGR